MRVFAALALLVAIGATGAPATVTVAPANLSFKQAMTACPGALAGITFTLGHLRIAEQSGVDSDIDASNPAAQVVTLAASNGGGAKVTVNATTHQVTAKNVTLSGKNVACVAPD
ncbi:MAG: hypothetical protein JO199_06050 [Candidatus Eremiobacteraeota bacterium]|nr:hypothetical protein [Candidatus Eremiobacteraeota bacterium]